MKFKEITPVIVNEIYFEAALKSDSEFVVFEMGSFITLKEKVRVLNKEGKKVFVKINEIEGLKEEDEASLEYLLSIGVFGITSNKTKVLNKAKKMGLKVVYTAFVLDTQSFATTLKNIQTVKPDIVEVRPGVIAKVIREIRKENPELPIWATGLITEEKEIKEAIEAGAQSIVTSKITLW